MKSMSAASTLIGWENGRAGIAMDSVADMIVSYT
jgi:hypothetical protein